MAAEPFILTLLRLILAVPGLTLSALTLPLHSWLRLTEHFVAEPAHGLCACLRRWLCGTVALALTALYVSLGPLAFLWLGDPDVTLLMLAAGDLPSY